MHSFALLYLVGGALAGPIHSPIPTETLSATYSPSRSLAPLVQAVQPAVVALEVTTRGRTVSGRSQERTGKGSGFVVSRDGLLLTNAHVIGTANVVTAHFDDGTDVQADVLGRDSAMDIAVLRLRGDRDWDYLPTAVDADLLVGDWVMAMGNAMGMGMTVTTGIVSAKGRGLGHNTFAEDNYIQTDAAINMGNSGGPLFDLEGNVVGINTAIIVGANTIGFAIPIGTVTDVLDDLVTTGKISRGYFGVAPQSLTPRLANYLGIPENTQGAVLAQVFPNTPAEKAGLVQGDLVVSIDGKAVSSPKSMVRLVATKRPGDAVQVDLIRKGQPQKLTFELGERPSQQRPPG